MAFISEFFRAVDYSSPATNGFMAFFCTWLGFRLSVIWNDAKIEEARLLDKEDLFKNIEFFLADCTLSINDGAANLRKNMPPHHPLPDYSMDYFITELMRHKVSEKLIARVASLRFGIIQTNTLLPLILNMFNACPSDAIARVSPPNSLQLHCDETLKRYEDVADGCIEVAKLISESRKSEKK